MKVAIHQPHYFPWLGYLDKMARVDKFVIMDEVQLEERSPMVRNMFLDSKGQKQPLTISIQKKGFLQKKTNEILLSDDVEWQNRHKAFFENNYKRAPFFNQISSDVFTIFDKKYERLIDVEMDSIRILNQFFDIKTEIVMQSSLTYNINAVKDDLVLELCKACNAEYHLFGSGSKKYVDEEIFKKNNIRIEFQQYEYPIYPQINSAVFINNLSSLDMLFNCGITRSREMFWNNVKKTDEFGSGRLPESHIITNEPAE